MHGDDLEGRLTALEAKFASVDPRVPITRSQELYTTFEVSQRLRCRVTNVYALVKSGDLPVVRVGAGNAGFRFRGDDLLNFLDSRREGGPKPRMAFKRLGL